MEKEFIQLLKQFAHNTYCMAAFSDCVLEL